MPMRNQEKRERVMKHNLMNRKAVVIFCALLCCGLWGISTPIVKMGYSHVDPTHVPSLLLWAGLQFVVSGLLTIGVYSAVSRKFLFPQKGSGKGVALLALLQTVLQYSLLYTGLLYTSSVKGAILKSTDVFFVALISSLIFRLETLTVKKLLSCVIGFAGIIVMNLNGLSLQISPLGDGLVLLGILSYSFSVIVTKLFAQKEDPIVLCGYQMALGGGVMLLIGVAGNGTMDLWGMLPVFVCLCAIYAVSYTLWTVLLKHNSPSGVTIYSFMTPVFGVLFSSFLLSEDGGVATGNLVVALILVCAGILLWGYEKKAAPKEKSPKTADGEDA